MQNLKPESLITSNILGEFSSLANILQILGKINTFEVHIFKLI